MTEDHSLSATAQPSRSMLMEFLKLYWRRKWIYLFGVLALVSTTGLASYLPVLIRTITAELRKTQAMDLAAVKHQALLVILVAVLMAVTRILSRLCFLGASRVVGRELRTRAFERLAFVSPSFFTRLSTGDVIARVTSDINVCRSVCGPGIMYFCSAILLYLACLYFMIQIDWQLTLLILVPYPFLLTGVSLAAARVKQHSRLAQEATGQLTSQAQETLAGIYVVKGFALEASQQEKFSSANEEVLHHNMTQAFQRSLIHSFVGLASGLTTLCVLWFGGRGIASGRISLEDFIAFLMYVGLLVQPTVYFGWITTLLARGGPALERVLHLIEAPLTITEPANPHSSTIKGAVEFKSLSFRYPAAPVVQSKQRSTQKQKEQQKSERRLALDDISFEVKPGEIVGLFGSVGSGKSTLLQSVPRLLETGPETIFVDGVPIERWSLDSLRGAMGYVPQDGVLFSMTLRDNICLGVPNATDEEVRRVLKISCLEQDLESLPNGLDTVVGERGVTLSGGQRQRTAIARALLMNPTILLLDDALSMIDAETASRILSQLQESMKNMTVLLAAHRTAALLGANKLYVLEAGAVIESGSPEELMASGGTFAVAAHRQQLQHELEVS